MKSNRPFTFSLLIAHCSLLFTMGAAHAATFTQHAPQFLSQSGQIQNVQNYSSNPFWNPNGPYNQRMPQPIYAQGADLNTGDCARVVQNLVSSVCAAMDNCRGMSLSDVRPTVMVRLSQLPGHNYASSCAGYIDTAFDDYMAQYGNAAAAVMGRVNFPGATAANPNANAPKIKFENPYVETSKTWNREPWQQEKNDRRAELTALQAQNGANNAGLVRESFPTTYNDLSFADRIANETAGLAPWKDADAYNPLDLESEEDYMRDQVTLAQLRAGLNWTNTDDALEENKEPETKTGGQKTEQTVPPQAAQGEYTPSRQMRQALEEFGPVSEVGLFIYKDDSLKPNDVVQRYNGDAYWSFECGNAFKKINGEISGHTLKRNHKYFLDTVSGGTSVSHIFPGIIGILKTGLIENHTLLSFANKESATQAAQEFAAALKANVCSQDKLSIYLVDVGQQIKDTAHLNTVTILSEPIHAY